MRLIKSICAITFFVIVVQASVMPRLGQTAESTRPPNFVYIMLDEWAYFELSCMGNKLLETPVIDQMAEDAWPCALEIGKSSNGKGTRSSSSTIWTLTSRSRTTSQTNIPKS